MERWVKSYERFLRISEHGRPDEVMRMRAVWIIGAMICATQLANFVLMFFIYHTWTFDHTLTLVAVAIILGSMQMVRWFKNPFFYSVLYSILMVTSVLAAALYGASGINTAILPLIAIGPLMAGFIAGRRAATTFCGAGTVLLVAIYWVSLNNPSLIAPFDYSRETNRFIQAMFVLYVSTGISVLITESVYTALENAHKNAQRARRAEAAKSQFLATMSHELRTPLNGVIGLTDAVLNGDLPAREKKLTETIRTSGESLLLILNDMLDLSKIEAGMLTLEPRPTDLRDLVRFVCDNWREAASAKGVTVTAKVTGPIPPAVMIDDLRLRQILQNLVSNGVKFSAHGHVVVHLHATARGAGNYRLDIRVSDTGKGIPDNLIERVFEPFEQGERGTSRVYGGTGLGLPICRELAGLLGGKICVEKTADSGTTFLLTLAVDAVTVSVDEMDDEIYDAASDLSGLRVLVAEDNEVNRLVVGEFLKSWGIAPVFACDGQECLDLFEDGSFDVVLVDKNMPIMGGIEVVQTIRQRNDHKAATPIIAVTADAMSGEREEMLAAGMNDFITKPLRADALKAMLVRTMKEPKAA
ncbi:ATP-binding protein [Hyphococcus sp. DH-69]|uniref:ATP-binding protein n=1 Tax=Hyphococcus formosus TaxID=3143534 RepID=UPI00398B4CEC